MSINENTRLIDLKVSDLLALLKESTPQSSAPNLPDEDEIGGYGVAEKITGYARQTLYQLKSSGDIPYIALPNGGIRFSKKALISWLLSHKKMTSEEIAAKAESYVSKRHLRRR